MNDHPLRPNEFLTAESIAVLRAHWIESVEQLLGSTASPAARVAVRDWIGLDEVRFDRLLDALRLELGSKDEADHLSRPTPGGQLGLVLPDKDNESSSPTTP